MTNQLTEEELRLGIGDAILDCSKLSLDDLIEKVLPSDVSSSNLSPVLESFIADEFHTQSKNQCRFLAKNHIANMLENGSSEFIRKFVEAKTEDMLIKLFPPEISNRLLTLKEHNLLGSLLVECTRVFNKLREKFSPAQSENKLRVFLIEWFQSGLMPLSIWKAFNEWKINNPTLEGLRKLKETDECRQDTKWREFKRLLAQMKTDNFVDLDKINVILGIFFKPAQITVTKDKVKLIGRIVYLSEWVSEIENQIQSNNVCEVAIYAEDNLIFDCDLTNRVWMGRNLIIVSKTINIWKNKAKINLSGESFISKHAKATSAPSTAYRGADGKHGRAGESSGNLVILAVKMFNSSKLIVELNGGRGEDGEDGGDGCDGADGVGVTKNDLDKLVVNYSSLYRDSWSNFDRYSAPSNWTLQSSNSSNGDYIYRIYKDEHGRLMTYSFAGDKGWTYTTYELIFLIRGSNGTYGTSGGSNGVGGQGGYNGTCVVKNPETNEDFQINLVREGKSNGPNGNNGQIGKSGKHGINGNDMALIDRSAKEASKHYEGSTDRKLDWSYVYTAEYKSRLDGYKRYSEKANACFIKFKYGEVISTTEQRATKAQEQTVRKTSSEAVAKQSIVLSKVISESESLFGKQNSFLADACQASAKASLSEEAEQEEEANENVTEEVVILRQKEETNLKYSAKRENKTNNIISPELYVARVKSLKIRNSTLKKMSQLLFDFFDIEFSPALLDSISLNILFRQIKYRQQMNSSFALVLVSAMQAEIENGKSYDEIKSFNESLVNRRKLKLTLSRSRKKFQNIIKETDAHVNPILTTFQSEADRYFGVKECELSETLAPFVHKMNIKKVVEAFFAQYITKEANLALLNAFNTFLTSIRPQYLQLLDKFAKNDSFKWENKDSVEAYMNELSLWLIEKKQLNDKSKEKKSTNQIRDKTELETNFITFVNTVRADHKYWSNLIEPVDHLISKNDIYKARFGSPSKSKIESAKNMAINLISSNEEEKNIELAKHLIKIFYLAKSILSFNQALYIYNAMMLQEMGYFKHDIKNLDGRYDVFLTEYSKNPVQSEDDRCENYMIKHGLNCLPFRSLLCTQLNIKLSTYRLVGFKMLEKIETLNQTALKSEKMWLKDDSDQPVGIAPDMQFLAFIDAQKSFVTKYKQTLDEQIDKTIKLDYNQKENKLEFASFIPVALGSAVFEWIENYIIMTNDQCLIQLLYSRMWTDGCHLTLFDLQAIILLCIKLKEVFYCDMNYLLILANSVEQNKLIDVFLYIRLEYQMGKRFSTSSRIFDLIQSVKSSRYKALLTVKLSEYKDPVEEDDLYKILLMLQNASNGSEQLEKIGLDEWISIARKQKWSEIGYLLQTYGSIGYYLGLLDNKGFKEEEKNMREVISQSKIVPEKLIALYSQWIVTNEITGDEKLFSYLEKKFKQANEYPGLSIDAKYHLITNEIEQAKLLNFMDTSIYKMASTKDRKVDEFINKITGLHDSPDAADKRKVELLRIADLLKENDGNKSKNILWLNKFDDAMCKLKQGRRLRDTQKMAILCAVESDKHMLEQVNTGEGKSFIIAAIATILIKTGKRYVDIITSSPVLAERDSREMIKLYEELGLTVDHNCSEDIETRKKAYTANIVYGDIARFQRDYLLHTFYKKLLKGDRTQCAVIVDEVDNMLLDNGNNMLYLSHSIPGIDLMDSLLIFLQEQVCSPIYNGDLSNNSDTAQNDFDSSTIKKKVLADLFGQFTFIDLDTLLKNANMNETRLQAIYDKLIKENIVDSNGYLMINDHEKLDLLDKILANTESCYVQLIKTCLSVIISRERKIELPMYLRSFAKLHLDELIENARQALFMEPDTSYVVDTDHTGKMSSLEPLVTIIDSNTGADLATSQWSGGLHQFLQLKHGCRLSPMSLKAVFVSNVTYLKRYERINGLSGTLGSTEESKTLIDLYGADLIKIPTSKPKVFYEHVPIIATKREEWISNIYNEICDQVSAMRSLLLICEDIKQLEYVFNKLKDLFEKGINAQIDQVKECFANVTIYKREHDEFDFEDEHKLEPCRLIIATNLAGRGTDIKLSDAVVNSGGLHVITCFMPKNCRVEEQAFGRAARCGQPGSAQIIAFAEPLSDMIQPSVFQLKMFRDNAEVHRLQMLKSFYDYHTEIEESCLQKFQTHCDSALTSMYATNKGTSDHDNLPTPSQVVYFSLLDQWALWLDNKSPLIKQSSLEYNQNLKDSIIKSVEEFLEAHPFGNQSNCFEVAKSWINSPQALLTIGIIQMFHDNGFKDADETFDRVLADGYEFAAEAYYYKACMRMRNFSSMRYSQTSLELKTKEIFKHDIEKAIEYFYKSRTAFSQRLNRKHREAASVAKMMEKLPENNPKTSGFASQIKSITTYLNLVLTNIDYLIGSPCESNMFMGDGISEEYSKHIHDSLIRQGIISPVLLTGGPIENWQVDTFRKKYKLHKKQMNTLIDEMSRDAASQVFENLTVLDKSILIEKCPISTKSDFWVELEAQHALIDQTIYLFVSDKSTLSKELADQLSKAKTFTIGNDDETRICLRYCNETSVKTLYKLEDVQVLLANNPKLIKEIEDQVNKESLKLDKLATVLIVPDELTYFSRFDGVTLDDLVDFFNLNEYGAAWIMNRLQDSGVLMLQTVQMMRLTSKDSLWESLVRSQLKIEAKQPKDSDPVEIKLLYQKAGILQQIRDDKRLLNVSKEVIENYCNISDNDLNTFYAYLEKKNILEPYLYKIYRLNSKLDCSTLPPCIASQIDEFLADRFAYSFALEELCMSLEKANSAKNPSPSQIFLPENPFRDFHTDLIESGLAMPSRICVSSDNIDDIDFDDFQYQDKVKSVVHSNRMKLFDQTDYHMELVSFNSYVNHQGFLIDADLNNIQNNGLKMVVSRRKESTSSWLLNGVLFAVSTCWNVIKTAACAVGSFLYSIVQFTASLPGKIFKSVSNYISPYVKQAGELIMRIAKPLLDTKLGKAAVEVYKTVEYVAEEVAYKAVDAAEWVWDKGVSVVNYTGKLATDVVNWIGDTKIVKGAVGLVKDTASFIASTSVFKTAVEMATFIYMKMSNFCTAVAESYQYYNQCRTMARRIVNTYPNLVDEHIILRSCNDVMIKEAKLTSRNIQKSDSIRKMIESWREPLAQSLIQNLNKRVEITSDNEKYNVEFIKAYLKSSSTITTLKVEINNLLNYFAWTKQVLYYRKLKDCFDKNIELSAEIVSIKVEGIPLKIQFYIHDAVDQILEGLQNKLDDEAYESDSDDHVNNEIDISSIQPNEYKNWKDYMNAVLNSIICKSVDAVFIERTISIILSFIEQARDGNLPPSEAEYNFTQEDLQLKHSITKKTLENKTKQKAKFLSSELHSITKHIVSYGDIRSHKNLIRHAIKCGYPLPLSSAKMITIAFDNFLKSSNIYNGGLNLEVKDSNKKVLISFNCGKAKLNLREFNGFVYICQSDYRSSLGMSNQMSEEVDSAFFYEAFISYMKMHKNKFAKKAETLREGLLIELDKMH